MHVFVDSYFGMLTVPLASNVPDWSKFNFAINDFMLVIQTKAMHQNLNKFGNRLIAIDAIHNTTRFGFKLIACFFVDPHRNCGLPVLLQWLPLIWTLYECNVLFHVGSTEVDQSSLSETNIG